MNRLYPVFLKTEGKTVLVVGGGKVAAQKIKGLLDCGADVTVVAPSVTQTIESLYAEGKIRLIRREYMSRDVEGFFIVIGATDDPSVQEEIFADARDLRIPVNVADKPGLCTFYLASVFGEGDLKVAVSTNGKSPTTGKIIRDKIAAEFSDGFPEIIFNIGQIRPDVQKSFPDYQSRKKVHEQFVKSELAGIGKGNEKGSGSTEIGVRRTEHGSRKGETGNWRPEAGDGKKKQENRIKKLMPWNAGKVCLVGAGPGDPELITLKGLLILRSAEVVLYDALVSEGILSEAAETAELIYVGKRAGARCMKQDEINAILIEKASEGKSVVRLKGGDPFMFGRGGEEMEALREAGIEVEIVPGITAGIGVPTSLGLPLTRRREASSVLFLTGHEAPAKPAECVDWKSVSHVDTIVIYMGSRKLRSVTQRLIENGVAASKPVAVIFGGTLDGERVVTGALDDISERVGEIHSELPGIIVVGETVRSLNRYASGGFALCAMESEFSTTNVLERNSSIE